MYNYNTYSNSICISLLRVRTYIQCSNEMQQILRLARRDGDEWVRLFASVLASFPHNQTISVDQITDGGLEGLQEEIADACKWGNIFGIALYRVQSSLSDY